MNETGIKVKRVIAPGPLNKDKLGEVPRALFTSARMNPIIGRPLILFVGRDQKLSLRASHTLYFDIEALAIPLADEIVSPILSFDVLNGPSTRFEIRGNKAYRCELSFTV